MYDLVIIGGGPAGTSAAITAARRGAKVLLLEKGSFPRQKVCGEFVSAESLELLSSLLSGSELMKDYRRIGRARVFVENRMLEMPVEPAAGSIGRVDLDVALWNAAKGQGVDAREHQKVEAISGTGPFVISVGGSEFESRSVIDASGRWSNISRRDGNGYLSSGKWMGLKAHFRESRPSDSVDLYFFNGGYCGVQPVGTSEGHINVCAMVRSDVSKSLPQTLEQHPELKRRSMRWEQMTDVVATSPLIFHKPEPYRGSVLRVGDAAGFVDPFVGDGISLALRGGALAASSLWGFLHGRDLLQQAAENYRETYSRELAHVFNFSSRIRSLFAYPAPVRAAILYALVSFPALTRYMVRKTR